MVMLQLLNVKLGTLKPQGKGMLGPLGLTEATEAWKRLVTSERAVVVVAETGLVSVQASALHALACCSLLGHSSGGSRMCCRGVLLYSCALCACEIL